MPLRTTTPLLALLAFALLAAPQLHAQDARPSLNVGYYEFPPTSIPPRDGHAAGSGARLVRLLLERAGYRPAFRALPSARLYLGLQDGSVALWAGAAKPELAADTLQARRVLGHVSLNLYYPAHHPAPRVPQDLAGRRLILISGYSYWKPVTDFIQDPTCTCACTAPAPTTPPCACSNSGAATTCSTTRRRWKRPAARRWQARNCTACRCG